MLFPIVKGYVGINNMLIVIRYVWCAVVKAVMMLSSASDFWLWVSEAGWSLWMLFIYMTMSEVGV